MYLATRLLNTAAFGMLMIGILLLPRSEEKEPTEAEFREPTEAEFREDVDFLQAWFNEHNLERFKAIPSDFVTNGKHVWKLNLEIKRPRLTPGYRGNTWH